MGNLQWTDLFFSPDKVWYLIDKTRTCVKHSISVRKMPSKKWQLQDNNVKIGEYKTWKLAVEAGEEYYKKTLTE